VSIGQPNASDRRQSKRTKVSLPVRVTVRGRPHMGFIVSLSTSGVRIKTDAPCVPRERVQIQMLFENAPLKAFAEVVRLTSLEVACKFESLELDALRAIAALTSASPHRA